MNPYRLGFVGSSDYHSATSATEEDNRTGALGDSDFPYGDNVKRVLQDVNPVIRQPITVLSASGITGVWAEQNTREAIFAALQRREVYATSGPRIQVRMFAGWSYPAGLVRRADWVRQAYAAGVPMGADLARAPAGAKSPRFLVHAQKDPDGANLDRIQIIKVWRQGGVDNEKVVDVAWSGNRKRDPKSGKVPEVGNSVDTKTATYRNDIGAAQLVRRVGGSGIRLDSRGRVLRARDRDSDSALAHLSGRAQQPAADDSASAHAAGTGLDLADLLRALSAWSPCRSARAQTQSWT